jgi:hypothetical protein
MNVKLKVKPMLWLSLLCLSQVAFAAAESTPKAQSPTIKITMRDNGYTLGDTIAMQAEFNLPKDLEFDANSVPLKGPVNNWLDLREVSMSETKNADNSNKISINFIWQIFGTVEHAKTLKIPAVQLQTIAKNNDVISDPTNENSTNTNAKKSNSPDKPLAITIPAQRFNLSPVLPPTITENNHRPHAPPLRFDTRTPLTLGVIFLVLSALSAISWLWLQDKISWWPRNPGPITKLSRRLKSQEVSQQTTFSLQQLRNIHAALADCAGQSLYPNTTENLFKNAPYLSAEKQEIMQFFNASWQQFFASDTKPNIETISISNTIRWVNHAAIAERIFRASQLKNNAGKIKPTSRSHLVKA